MEIIKGEPSEVNDRLDALPEGAIVQDERGALWEKVSGKWSLGGFDGVGLTSESVGSGKPIKLIAVPSVQRGEAYCDPRVIGLMPNYVEDRLNELREGAVILDRDGAAWQKVRGQWLSSRSGAGGMTSRMVGGYQPFRVIWEGGE